jgi:hypothetical protein
VSSVTLRGIVSIVALAHFGGCERSRPVERAPARAAVDGVRDSYIRRALRPATGCPGAASTSPGEGSLHGDTVASVERWLAAESPHRVPYGLHVHPGGALTIEPCALVLVGPRMEVVVHAGATLRAAAGPGRPIRFARLDPALPWQALEVREEALAGTTLDGVVLEGGGAAPVERGITAATLRVGMRAGLSAAGLSIVGGDGWGVAVLGAGRFVDRDTTIELRGLRGEGAVTVEDVNRVAGLPRLSMRDNVSNDVRVEARVRTLSADARWRSPGPESRYRVRPAMHLIVEGPSSPVLTLEAGTRVSFGAGAELDVGFGAPGALAAEGEDSRPVVFDGADEERWVGIQLGPRLDASRSRLRSVRVAHAGAPSGVVLPSCGCPDGHPDEAMLTLQGVSGPVAMQAVSFIDGPWEGFAILWAGNYPDFAAGLPADHGALDFTRSGVRCPVGAPLRRGRCAPEARIPAETP